LVPADVAIQIRAFLERMQQLLRDESPVRVALSAELLNACALLGNTPLSAFNVMLQSVK
jgi:hypothetical protein